MTTPSPLWKAISAKDHANSGWRPSSNYRHAASSSSSPLLANEVALAVGVYPLAFLEDGDSFQLVALHSLEADVNIYVNKQGRWLASYIPAWQRSHPMRLLRHDVSDGHLLCVDVASEAYRSEVEEKGDLRFFDDQGKATEELEKIFEFLQQCHKSRALTERLVGQLAEAGLIQPWGLQSQNAAGEVTDITGLFQIDETKLQQLPGEVLTVLAESGALAIAYGQLFSRSQLNVLAQRYHYRRQEEKGAELDVDELFDGGEDDTLNFGF